MMVAVDGRSKNRPGPRKVNIEQIGFTGIWNMYLSSQVDGRKFNKPGVKKAEHEKVKHWCGFFILSSLEFLETLHL